MLNGLCCKFCEKSQKALRNEKGQALAEHSFLLSISGFIANSFDVLHDHQVFLFAVIAGIAFLIILLFWKPRVLGTIIFIAVIIFILFLIYRWAEYGHI